LDETTSGRRAQLLAGTACAVRGPLLLVASNGAALAPVLQRLAALDPTPPASQSAVSYRARFQRAVEHDNFQRLMRHLDEAQWTRYGGSAVRPPAFFSDNIAGLSRTLARVASQEVTVEERGDSLVETVNYRFAP
jgi:hypothetical protein